MQERPRGQKKPSQQGRGKILRTGITSLSRPPWVILAAAQPASHPKVHDVALQLRFGVGLSKSLMLLKYNFTSPIPHRRCEIVPSAHKKTYVHDTILS